MTQTPLFCVELCTVTSGAHWGVEGTDGLRCHCPVQLFRWYSAQRQEYHYVYPLELGTQQGHISVLKEKAAGAL